MVKTALANLNLNENSPERFYLHTKDYIWIKSTLDASLKDICKFLEPSKYVTVKNSNEERHHFDISILNLNFFLWFNFMFIFNFDLLFLPFLFR